LKSYLSFRHHPLEKDEFARPPRSVMSGRRRLLGANSFQEDVAAPAASALARSHLTGGAHVPPPGLKPVDNRKLTRLQRRAIKRAHKLDRDFFRRNPLRLTRVRRAVDGETEHAALYPDKRCFVVVRQTAPGVFVFTDCNLVEIASSESVAAEIYELMLEDEQREWSTKAKQLALGEQLAVAPVHGEA
jgi:hypothetical protein